MRPSLQFPAALGALCAGCARGSGRARAAVPGADRQVGHGLARVPPGSQPSTSLTTLVLKRPEMHYELPQTLEYTTCTYELPRTLLNTLRTTSDALIGKTGNSDY